jgi:hypothetical protein
LAVLGLAAVRGRRGPARAPAVGAEAR